MSIRRLFLFLLVAIALLIATGIPTKSNPNPDDELIVGRNVNMVAGQDFIDGDPYLQRQNEPSIAVSTRNPMHLLAASNDYRTVDWPESEGPLPGITQRASSDGDAWLGIYKSYNSGQSWTSTLLPGYPQDITAEGKASPLYGYSTVCDPTVRAGVSGLFFTSGIAFDRAEHGNSAIFVSRYIDNNTQAIGDMDSIKYMDVNIIDEGTSGQFADKPWIAIDAPKNSDDTVQIYVPVAPGEPGGVQDIPRFNVYIVYSIFLGSSPSGDHSKIMFARSTDSGNSWERPVKLSESVHVCQGTNIAVSPKDGNIFIVWRQYAREDQGAPHAIVTCMSDDLGSTFTKAAEVAVIDPFDQYTDVNRFRTSAFPALAVDPIGVVYVAWSQRGVGSSGEARIVIKTSIDGINWSGQKPVDNHGGGGHQIMPSLTCAGGKLMMTWYDTRKSLGYIYEDGTYAPLPENEIDEISDPGPTGMPHTIDVWVAQAVPSEDPVFTSSIQASRYLYQAETNVDGSLKEPLVIYQAQFSFPNFPIFMGGNGPFMGDYLDITPAPMFLYDEQAGWRFNTGEGAFDPTLSYITFACNRDVIPPSDPLNWTNYWPPGSGDCSQYTAGMRNQNIYSAPITHGIMVGAPVNTKPLWLPQSEDEYIQKRTFLVFAKNLTDKMKLIRLTIDAPNDMDASFWEFGPPQNQDPPEVCEFPFELCEDKVVEVSILPHSTITLTVFVGHYEPNFLATFRVNVEEIIEVPDENPIIGLRSSVVFNPDPVNTQLIDPEFEETHNPFIIVEDPDPVNLSDPTMLSDQIVYSPYLEELLSFANPDIVAISTRNPRVRNPRVRNDTIINPRVRNSAVGDISQGEVTDLRWTVKNDGNTTSAYSFEPIGETPSVPNQLLIHRVSSTPVSAEQCLLAEEEHHELLLSVENPRVRNPRVRNPRVRNPRVRNNTFFLAPGEEAVITLRLIDPKADSGQEGMLQSTQTQSGSFDPEFYSKTVAGAAIPQAANPNGEIETAAFMWIYTTTLPDGSVNDPYPLPEPPPEPNTPAPDKHLEAEGGTEPYTWGLVPGYGDLPPGLTLDSDGLIHGEPSYNTSVTYPKTYNFAVQATDSEEQIAYRSLSITVECIKHIITATAGELDENENFIEYDNGIGPGGTIFLSGAVGVVHGLNQSFTITINDCYELLDVVVEDAIEGPEGTYTFENVRKDGLTIKAIFQKLTYPISAQAGELGEEGNFIAYENGSGPGGSISPAGEFTVDCGSTPTFTISPNSCYFVADVRVNGESKGGVLSLTLPPVKRDYTIEAIFALKILTITASAGELDQTGNVTEYPNGSGQGGSISPAGVETVTCGLDSQIYEILTNEGYMLTNVLVDGAPAENIIKGPVITYTFENVLGNHTLEARFIKLEAWVERYNNNALNGDDEASDIAVAVDPSGNSFVTGFSLGSTTGPDFYTIGYDSDGNVGLSARYDGPSHEGDKANAITADGSGNVYVTGFSYRGQPQKHSDYLTVKYKSSGELVWDERYDARRNGNDVATAIAVDDSGYVYITGKSEDSLSKQRDIKHYDYYTIKYDPNRRKSTIWGKRYNNDSVNGADEAAAIAVDSGGNVYVTGRSEGNGTGFDIVTIKYLPNGELDPNWGNSSVVRYDNNGSPNTNDEAAAIAVHSSGNVYVTGKSEEIGTSFDIITLKYLPNGELDPNWGDSGVVRYDNNGLPNGHDEATAIAVHSSGNVYVTGYSWNGTNNDYVTIMYDNNESPDWAVRYDNNGIDEAADIAIDTAGNAYVTGRSQAGGYFDYYTVKYDSSGNMVWRVRYDSTYGNDEARALVLDSLGNVYVTGRSQGKTEGGVSTGFDYATIKYKQ